MTIKVTIVLLLAAVVSIFIHPPRALANPEDKTLVFFMPDTNWPPYTTGKSSELGKGVLVEILEEVTKALGMKLIVTQLPDRRGWIQLNNGDVDAHAKAKEWTHNPEQYIWTDPFLESVDVLLTRSDSTIEFNRLEDLYGQRIAVIESFVYPALEPFFKSGAIIRIDVPDPYRMLELVRMNRADSAVVNQRETLWLFKESSQFDADDFRLHDTVIGSAWYRYLFTPKNGWEPYLGTINTELKKMKTDGRLTTILNRYQ